MIDIEKLKKEKDIFKFFETIKTIDKKIKELQHELLTSENKIQTEKANYLNSVLSGKENNSLGKAIENQNKLKLELDGLIQLKKGEVENKTLEKVIENAHLTLQGKINSTIDKMNKIQKLRVEYYNLLEEKNIQLEECKADIEQIKDLNNKFMKYSKSKVCQYFDIQFGTNGWIDIKALKSEFEKEEQKKKKEERKQARMRAKEEKEKETE